MPRFLHKTLLRASHVMNVIEGDWVSMSGHKQYLLHYGNSFEIVEYRESDKRLESVFWQPLFAKVQFVCDGPVFGKYSSFLAFRASDVLCLCYSESDHLFTTKKRFPLPKDCFNPSFGFYRDDYIIVSAPSGGLCSLTLRDGTASVYPERVSSAKSCFQYKRNQIVRVEDGGKVSIYTCPDLTLVFREIYSELQYAFPFGYNGYALWNRDDMLVHVHGDSVYVDLPLDDISNSAIDHVFLTYNYTVLLTREGNLFLFSDSKIFEIGKYDHAYAVFRLSSRRVMVCRHGMEHVILNVEPLKGETVLVAKYRGMSRIMSARVCEHRLEIISRSSLCVCERGIAGNVVVAETTGKDLENVGVFEWRNKVCLSLSFANQASSFRTISDGRVEKLRETGDFRTNVSTIGMVSLYPDVLVQLHAKGCIALHGNQPRVYDFSEILVNYSAASRQLVLLMRKGSPMYLTVNTESPNKIVMAKLKIGGRDPHKAIHAAAFPPVDRNERSDFLVVCDQNRTLQLVELDFASIVTGQMSCLCTALSTFDKKPASLQFMSSLKLCIGFEDGNVIVTTFDSKDRVLRDDLLFRIGTERVKFSGNFAVSSRLWMISDDDLIAINPIMSTNEAISCISRSNKEILFCTKHSLKLLSIENSSPSESIQYMSWPCGSTYRDVVHIPDTSNYILAAAQYVEIYDVEDFGVEELVQFDAGETFGSMLLTEKHLVIASWCEQGSEVRVFKIGDDHIVLSPPVQFSVTGRVQTISEFKNGLLLGSDDVVLFYGEFANRWQIISRTDGIGKNITTIITDESAIYVGDERMAILTLEYINERHMFCITAQDTCIRQITCMCKYRESAAAGDGEGSVVIYDLPRNFVNDLSQISGPFMAKRAIPIRVSYHVGEVISAITRVDGQDCYDGILYSTVVGTIGCLLEHVSSEYSAQVAFETNWMMLKKVELEMAKIFDSRAKSDFIQFRNSTLPCGEVVDLDIVEIYRRMPVPERERIAQIISRAMTPEMIDQMIETADIYFKYVY